SRIMDQVVCNGCGEPVADAPSFETASNGRALASNGDGVAHNLLPRRPAPSVQRTFFPLEAEEATEARHGGQKATARTARRAAPCPAMPLRQPAMLETFVVGPSNCLAHKAAQLTTEQPGTYSPLFLYGTTGVGKSHLLEGICTAFRRAHPRNVAVYLSAEQ